MVTLSKTWTLDSKLAEDTLPVLQHDLWLLRMVNDARWPWLMLVPKVPGAEDIDDLPMGVQQTLLQEAARVSRALKMICEPKLTKTNIGALGNVVRQFHLHIVGRRVDDPNWPGPIWGYETAVPYSKDAADRFIETFKRAHRSI